MTKTDQREIDDAASAPTVDLATLIAALRTAGADRFDPARWHYIDALSRRAEHQRGQVRRILETKLAQVLSEYQRRFEQAHCEAEQIIDRAVARHPKAANELKRLLGAGDFSALERFASGLDAHEEGGSLAALVRQLEQNPDESTSGRFAKNRDESDHGRFELKTIRRFRSTWSKLSADTQVVQALAQPPKNAGPLNSHMLVLRSLALMRDLSPDYLARFMSYADTLLCLDQCEKDKPVTTKKAAAGKTAKK
jgi:hypothetical protein